MARTRTVVLSKRSLAIQVAVTVAFATVTAAFTARAERPVRDGNAQATGVATNLKVLPRNTSTQDLYKVMAGMQRDLGVQCGFCHEEDEDTKKIDYASDQNPRKETARFMMRMTSDINTKYLGQLGDRQYAPPITCGNCHLGQMHPPPFDPASVR